MYSSSSSELADALASMNLLLYVAEDKAEQEEEEEEIC